MALRRYGWAPAWEGDGADVTLQKDEVHLWLIDLDQPEEQRAMLGAALDADERARAARFLRRQHQDRFTVGRGALRVLLGSYLAMPPERLQLVYGPHGKPGLAEGDDGLRFNLSHSDRWALLGVVRGSEIGVDIEAARDMADMAAVARRTFSARENRELAALPADAYRRGFYACWTRKEALVKAAGVGVAFELDWFEVDVDPALDRLDVEIGGAPAIAGHYALWCLEPFDGFPAAVALRGSAGPGSRQRRLAVRIFRPPP